MELKTARQIARLTQQELADRAGVDDSFISLIESGKREIGAVSYFTVVRLARGLGVDNPLQLFPVPDLPAAGVAERTA